MKEEVQKQQDEEAEEDTKQEGKKQKKSRFERPKPDPEHDPVIRRALDWLKSDVSVKQYKMEQQKPISDTAWYDKSKADPSR